MAGWETIELQVLTPLFAGSVDKRAEVKPSMFRGMARWWLRALVGGVVGNDLGALARVEEAVFGSTEATSPVRFRVSKQPTVCEPETGDFASQLAEYTIDVDGADENGPFAGIAYLLGPGVCEWRDKRWQLTRQYVPAGETIVLRVHQGLASVEAWVLARMSLWLALNLGGFGARKNRGFGALKVISSSDVLLGESNIFSAVSKFSSRAPELVRRILLAPGDGGGVVPSYPMLGEVISRNESVPRGDFSAAELRLMHATLHLSKDDRERFATSWEGALSAVGVDFRLFRANAGKQESENWYRPQVKTREWLEVVNGEKSHFPLAVLGLPIVFKKRGPQVEPRIGADKFRWPSQLRFRLVPDDATWRLLTVAFRTTFLPPLGELAPALPHPRASRQLHVKVDDIDKIAENWAARVDGTSSDPRPAPQRPYT